MLWTSYLYHRAHAQSQWPKQEKRPRKQHVWFSISHAHLHTIPIVDTTFTPVKIAFCQFQKVYYTCSSYHSIQS